ncbi:hypothetical protein HZA75_07990 [Candidatus Roizmanbacteria bacterium]|nr:hypothetical protein [Candidatus Roizmanbacteria bacterium]
MSQKIIPPGRRQIIKKLIEEKNRSLTINELIKFTGIKKDKIRQTLTTYDTAIVRVGAETYDTIERVYPGKTFRYTPKKIEVEKGVLFADEDVRFFLIGVFDYDAKIILVDENKNEYPLKTCRPSKNIPFSYYRCLEKWYKKIGFEYGDDILFTCLDFNQKKYKIVRQKKKDRDEFIIKIKNKKLADLVYNILSFTISKYELDMFLVRKYLFVYPYNDPAPPDSLVKAFWNDKRFLISTRDKMLSWSGTLLTHGLNIGLRKYYYLNEKGEHALVTVLSDEFGRYGFCTLCNQRLIWEKDTGWQHLENENDWADYLPKEFFKIGKEKSKAN